MTADKIALRSLSFDATWTRSAVRMKNAPALSGRLQPRDGSMLPETLPQVLTAQDQAALTHLRRRGIRKNTLRATRSDLAYLEAWSLAVDDESLPWPPMVEIVLRFVAHHRWDPDERAVDPNHGIPDHIRDALTRSGYLRSVGPHASATVRRRIATWRSLCRWRGVDHPFSEPEVTKTLAAAIRAAKRPCQKKSQRNVDTALIEDLLDHLNRQIELAVPATTDSIAERHRTLLATMFASGGRRRSEISAMM